LSKNIVLIENQTKNRESILQLKYWANWKQNNGENFPSTSLNEMNGKTGNQSWKILGFHAQHFCWILDFSSLRKVSSSAFEFWFKFLVHVFAGIVFLLE
jgi:hypothetical protein